MRKRALWVAIPVAILLLTSAAVSRQPTPSYVFTQTPSYQSAAWLEGKDRFPEGASLQLVTVAGVKRPLAPEFYASADAAISFDATRVLFSGRRTASDHWRIWEMSLARGATAAPRSITDGSSDCVRPLYLPEEKIVYTRLVEGGSYLELVSLSVGAAKPDRLTYGPARVLSDDVLADGRILFEMQQGSTRELFIVYTDGTGVESVRCDHGQDRADARQAASGDIIFTAANRLARFTSASAIQREVLQPTLDASGPIAGLSPSEWIVSLKTKTGQLGLYRIRQEQLSELEAPAGASAVQPVLVAERMPPKRFPSARTPARTWGNLLCLDARAMRGWRQAPQVSRIRAYTTGPHSSTPVLLGETAVERDGSFYIQVPADRPLRIEVVDEAGRTVEVEHNWFWMRPAEQRICVGCHAGPERSPENKVPDVLERSTVPTNMMGAK